MNLTIKARLVFAFLLSAAITAVLGSIGYYSVCQLGRSLDEIGIVRLPSIQGLDMMIEAQTAIDGIETALLDEEIAPPARASLYQRLTAKWAQADKGYNLYEPLPQTEQEAKD